MFGSRSRIIMGTVCRRFLAKRRRIAGIALTFCWQLPGAGRFLQTRCCGFRNNPARPRGGWREIAADRAGVCPAARLVLASSRDLGKLSGTMMKSVALVVVLACLGLPALSNPDVTGPDVTGPDPAETMAAFAPVAAPQGLSGSAQAVPVSLRPKARKAVVVPKARWDNIGGSRSWSIAVLRALRAQANELPDLVPQDIGAYCPAYPTAGRSQREAFWVGLISALAWHESTHRPTAVGGGGLWFGLVQIAPPTARIYKCKARNGDALKDPEDNLSCAMRIMAVTVPRDKVISRGMRGIAADWGPFHSSRKREDIMSWTRKQSYCQGLSRSLRPVARPFGLSPAGLSPVVATEG
jgi:hypothetical protein